MRGSRGRQAVAGAPRALLCCCILLHTAAYSTLLARCINIITRCPRWCRVRHMLSFSVGFEFRRSTRSVETVLLVVPPHAPTNACRACASALASFSFAFFLSRLSRAIRAILFNGGTAATAAATNTRASIVRRDCVFVFATPPNGLLLSPAVRRQAFLQRYYRIPLLVVPSFWCRLGPFGIIYPVPETSGVLLWVRPVGSACVRSIRLRARFRTRCGRRKRKKLNLEMHALRPSNATGYTTPSHRVGVHHYILWRRAWIAPAFTPFDPASAELFALQKGRIGTHSVVKIFAHSDMHAPLL